jgi:hypothetical protein
MHLEIDDVVPRGDPLVQQRAIVALLAIEGDVIARRRG